MTRGDEEEAVDEIFARQVSGLGKRGDVLVGMSTSGGSANVLRAFQAASPLGIKTLALLGRDGGSAAGVADVELIVPVESTARIQEAHIFILHYWAWLIESGLPPTRGDQV